MLKYDFSIQTRDGQKIASVQIAGIDQADAERKLRQMYLHCQVERCSVRQAAGTATAASVENIISLISK